MTESGRQLAATLGRIYPYMAAKQQAPGVAATDAEGFPNRSGMTGSPDEPGMTGQAGDDGEVGNEKEVDHSGRPLVHNAALRAVETTSGCLRIPCRRLQP